MVTLTATTVLVLSGSPAVAVEAPTGIEIKRPLHSPELAAGLSVAVPIGLMLAASRSPDFVVNFGVPVLGLGAGHLYAGEPLRGGLVAVASTLVGIGTFSLLNPSGGNGGGGAYVVALVASSVAIGLAATDAYFTTAEKNRQQLERLGPVAEEAP